MIKRCISKDWLFRAGGQGQYIPVDLPHDYSVGLPRSPQAEGGASNGYFQHRPDPEQGDVQYSLRGQYVKYFTPEADTQHMILDVDGAYMCSTVHLNRDQLSFHPYGYSPFLVDLTNGLRRGQMNKLTISTTALMPSTRWYAGAGLYRDVFLWTGGAVRVEPWDVWAVTERADASQAQLRVNYRLSSDLNSEARILAVLRDADGKEVTRAEALLSVRTGEKTDFSLMLSLSSPNLWDTENPYLYTLHTRIEAEGKLTDEAETTVGIRVTEADARQGFRLNGQPMKLRGGCIHHDHGVLGAASFPAAEERRIRLLKEAGFNAIRTAHNPPSLALLEACDHLGMLVVDEAFDMWNEQKNDLDYHLFFGDWWGRDIASMVQRDRSHPCVIAYSIGNEIPERDGHSQGAAWSARLAGEVRRNDNTRFVTAAVCVMWEQPEETDPSEYREVFLDGYADIGEGGLDTSWDKRTQAFLAPLDIVGYNYLYYRYASDHLAYPDRVIWGSETLPIKFYDSWQATMENAHVIGDFTWTACDYLGEAGIGRILWARDGIVTGTLTHYPWRASFDADLDLCGFRRPQSWFRESVWIGNKPPHMFTTHPEHTGESFTGTGWHWYDVHESWNFPDEYLGKPVKVEVYTDAEEVVFRLNGREAGRVKVEKNVAALKIPYERGELTAEAISAGHVCGKTGLRTVGAPVRIQVRAEKETIAADRRDLCYFDISVLDEEGSRVPEAKNELVCQVEGGELMGIFSADPANEDQYTSDRCHAFEGRAMAIVRTNTPGGIAVTVRSEGLLSGTDHIAAR